MDNANPKGVDEFIGCLIQADCSPQGIYKGRVISLDSDPVAITIENPYRDGHPLSEKTLKIPSEILRDIKVLRMPSPVSSSAAAATALPRKPSQPTPYALPPTTPVSSKKKHSMPTPMMLSPAPPKAHEKQEAKVSKAQTSLKENATMGEKISATTVESGLTGTEKTSKEEHFLKPMLPAISGIGHGKRQPITDRSNSAKRNLGECSSTSRDMTKSSGQVHTKRDTPRPPIVSTGSKRPDKWCEKSKSPQSSNNLTKKSSSAKPESKSKQIDVKNLVKSFAEPITIERKAKRLPNLSEEIDDLVGQVSCAEYVGCLVTIDFGVNENIQGRIIKIDPGNSSISLQTPFRNGRPMEKPIEIVSKEMLRNAKQLRVFKPVGDNVEDSDNIDEAFSTVQQTAFKAKGAEGSKTNELSSFTLKRNSNSSNSTSSTKSSAADVDTGGSETDDEQSSPQTHIVDHGRNRAELNEMSEGVAKLFASFSLGDNTASKANTALPMPMPTEMQSNSTADSSKSCKASSTVATRLYTDYGDFRLFNEKQMPTPQLLAKMKPQGPQQQQGSNSSNQRIGPSGIPTVDSNNGYGRFVSPSNRGLAATPINEDVLTTDFDFDANLALFNKDEFDRNFDRYLESEHREQEQQHQVKFGSGGVVSTKGRRQQMPLGRSKSQHRMQRQSQNQLHRNYRNNENVLGDDSSRVYSWTTATTGLSSEEHRRVRQNCGSSPSSN